MFESWLPMDSEPFRKRNCNARSPPRRTLQMAPASPHAGAVSLATEHRTCETARWRASWHPVNTAFNDSPQLMGLLDKLALSLANRARHETEMDQRRHHTNGQGAFVLCWDVFACQFLQWRWPSCWCACWSGPVADYNRSPRLRGMGAFNMAPSTR